MIVFFILSCYIDSEKMAKYAPVQYNTNGLVEKLFSTVSWKKGGAAYVKAYT